jgi:hypothetical protein
MPTGSRTVAGIYRDVRADDRWLRVAWHPGHGVFVFSVWREDECTATFQLARGASAELVADIVRSLSTPVEVTWSDRTVISRTARVRALVAASVQRLRRRAT